MSGRRISRRSVLALAACTALGAVGCSKTEEYTGPELILRYAENQPGDYPTTQAALAIRRGAHIRMTAFDVYLPKIVVKVLDILADLAVCILGLIMLVVGWNYATTLGGRGFYVSMPWLSRFWMYFPVPLAGVAMIIFEIEALYNHIKSFFVKEEN